MPLRHEPNVATAAWFATSTAPWRQVCSIGPSGFEQYGRLFHPLRNGADKDDPDSLMDIEGHLDDADLGHLIAILARHTSTPQDCFFGLWEGFGDIHGSPAVGFFAGRGRHPLDIPPAFPPEVLTGPRVEIPGRRYFLFRGRLDHAGHWGAEDMAPGCPRPINSPNLMWPADHAWFVATEIDLPWTGVAGTTELLSDLMADHALDTELVTPGANLPYCRP